MTPRDTLKVIYQYCEQMKTGWVKGAIDSFFFLFRDNLNQDYL